MNTTIKLQLGGKKYSDLGSLLKSYGITNIPKYKNIDKGSFELTFADGVEAILIKMAWGR